MCKVAIGLSEQDQAWREFRKRRCDRCVMQPSIELQPLPGCRRCMIRTEAYGNLLSASVGRPKTICVGTYVPKDRVRAGSERGSVGGSFRARFHPRPAGRALPPLPGGERAGVRGWCSRECRCSVAPHHSTYARATKNQRARADAPLRTPAAARHLACVPH